MANVCEYSMIVKGKKNCCYAFMAGQNWLDYKDVDYESGSFDDYTLNFYK